MNQFKKQCLAFFPFLHSFSATFYSIPSIITIQNKKKGNSPPLDLNNDRNYVNNKEMNLNEMDQRRAEYYDKKTLQSFRKINWSEFLFGYHL